ncbi:hypothetical protein PVAND_011788 [Polypedilum vanderplanki]|uniref:Uncharacterized protein n=1 Tax=Polypedilum vanderplanki TaxID=319348 RepID=A0A9J6CLA8_POLVA|nr:hypothetical protein PVAND_011788 [Polypedilum vanderplanki]
MVHYDPITRILHGPKLPQVYSSNVTLGQVILKKLYKTPDKVIQVCDDDGIELTCSQMTKYMINIAKNLSKLGFQSGDIAGLLAVWSTYTAPTIFACSLLSMPLNPIDTSFSVNQIVHIYRQTQPKIVFCDHDVIDKLMAALGILESEATIVILTERINGLLHVSDLLHDCDVSDDFIYQTHSNEKCSLIICTSGSSGNPKLACLTHLQQLQNFTWINNFNPDFFSFNMTSPYWLSGLNCMIFQFLHGRKRLITSKPYTPETFLNLIEKYKINDTFLVPPLLSLLIDTPRFKEADLSSIKYFVTGGLYVSENLRIVVQQKLINGKIKIGYGMTEFGGLLAETQDEFHLGTSVGYPTHNTEVKIQLDDGTSGGISEIGEILVRHPVRFLGYYKNCHKNIIDDEGWLHTSDMGFIDKYHEINIIGQRIFAIKSFYNEFFPSEVEEIIEAVDGVKQVVIVGTPDPVDIEKTTALIVKEPNSNVTEDLIYEATSTLPIYKQPRGGIFFLDNLPLTSTGKIKRKEAKELAKKLTFERNNHNDLPA